MIGYIKGKLLSHGNGTVLIENNGIGYEITCSSSAYSGIVNGGGGELYTYLQMREDAALLYGFVSKQEKNMFLKLISVSGIGPKMGIALLSETDINSLALAIASSDVKMLSSIKGVGKKTAERIILELREKVSSLDVPPAAGALPQAAAHDSDAVVALMTLGFSRAESIKAVKAALEGGAQGTEDVVVAALKNIG